MQIFPLSIPGKIVLIIIAIILGLIWASLQWPDKARAFFKKFKKGDEATASTPVKTPELKKK